MDRMMLPGAYAVFILHDTVEEHIGAAVVLHVGRRVVGIGTCAGRIIDHLQTQFLRPGCDIVVVPIRKAA